MKVSELIDVLQTLAKDGIEDYTVDIFDISVESGYDTPSVLVVPHEQSVILMSENCLEKYLETSGLDLYGEKEDEDDTSKH